MCGITERKKLFKAGDDLAGRMLLRGVGHPTIKFVWKGIFCLSLVSEYTSI